MKTRRAFIINTINTNEEVWIIESTAPGHVRLRISRDNMICETILTKEQFDTIVDTHWQIDYEGGS